MFVAPALLVLGVFFFLPVLAALAMSLTDFDLYALADFGNLRLVGFENYARLLREPLFWKALGNTLYFVVLGVPLSIGVSLGAALLVNSKVARFRGLFRTVFFAPVVTTLVAVAVVWRYIFHTRYGFLNYALASIGLDPIDWLGDPRWAMPAIVILAVWKNFGYNMIILLAALQNIPEDLYEAARIDGASGWQQFRHVTLPGLGPVLLLVSILTMTGYFQLFAEPYVMTEGGPLQSTLQRAVLHVRGRLQVVEPRARFGGRVPAVRADVRRDRWCSCASAASGAAHEAHAAHAAASTRCWSSARVLDAFPLLWMVSVSFMPTGAASTYPPPLLPAQPTLDNYRELFAKHAAGRYLFNSALVATLATLISLVFNTMAGYAFAKLRFRGRDRIFRALLGALVIPAQVAMIPLFVLVKELGLVSTLRRRHRAGAWRACSASSSSASTRCRSRTSCSRRRASTARARCGSSGRSSCRCCGRSSSRSRSSRSSRPGTTSCGR